MTSRAPSEVTVNIMTEAEFRAFAQRLHGFIRELTSKERLFLTAILARASSRGPIEMDLPDWDSEWTVAGELAFSIWQSMAVAGQSIGLNPQAIPASEEILPDQR